MAKLTDIKIEAVAEELGIKQASPNKFHCFTEDHSNGDKGASLTIYDPGFFECMGCGAKGHTMDLVRLHEGYDNNQQAAAWLKEHFDLYVPTKKTAAPVGKKFHLRFIKAPNESGKDDRFIELPKEQVECRAANKKDTDLIYDVLGKKYRPDTLNRAGVKIAPKVSIGKSKRRAIVFEENLPNKGIIFNPNGLTRYLHLEGRTDWLTAVELGLDNYYALVSDQSKTNFHLFAGHENVFIMDADNDEAVIREKIKDNCDLRFVRLPAKDLSEMFNSNGGTDTETICTLIDTASLISVLSGGMTFEEAETTLLQYRVTQEDRLLEPVPLIMCKNALLLSRGNIGVIAGSEGVMKSTFMRMIVAGAILPEQNDWINLADFTVAPNIDKKAVLFFDTEQSKHRQGKNLDLILRRAKLTEEPDYFQSYDMTGATVEEFKDMFKMAIQLGRSKFGGIHMVFVDQVADLMRNVNDIAEVAEIIQELKQIAKGEDCGLILVIHFNPGSEKERGHAGSEIRRKAEMNLNITRDQKTGIAELNFRKLREANEWDLPIYMLKYDDNKKMLVDAGKRNRTSDKGQELLDMFWELYSDNYDVTYQHSELVSHVIRKTNVSKATAKRRLQDATDDYEILIKTGDGREARYAIHPDSITKMSSGKEIFND